MATAAHMTWRNLLQLLVYVVLVPLCRVALACALLLPACSADVPPWAPTSTGHSGPMGIDWGPKNSNGKLISNQRIVYSDGLHNENTDLASWKGSTWLIFRGGESAQLGTPKARLKVWRSQNTGDSFTPMAEIFMPDRDIRDPKLVVQGGKLVVYAISRIPGGFVRDLGGLAWTVRSETEDGSHWTPPQKIYDEKWGFWRIVQHDGAWFATGYNDGDTQVGLFTSPDGIAWSQVSLIVDSPPDVPSEAELHFFGDVAVSLVRMDNGKTLLDQGQTAVCVAPKPWTTWDCGRRLEARLDGPIWFSDGPEGGWRHLVMARRHLPETHKRTSLFQLVGDLVTPTAQLDLKLLGDFQSSGDTAYCAALPLGQHQYLVSWYSSVVNLDLPWFKAMFSPSDIWLAWVDLKALPN